MDLMSILPLLGGHADMQTLITTLLGGGQPPKPAKPCHDVPVTEPPHNRYAHLYPDYQRIADLPRCDGQNHERKEQASPDLGSLLSLFAALKQNRSAPPQEPKCDRPAPPDDLAPTAPPDIRASLHAILSRTSLSCE